MPVLAWRDDADGFAFINNWDFDQTERDTLAYIADRIYPLVAQSLFAVVPSPALLIGLRKIYSDYINFQALPEYGLCGGMAYASLDYWLARLPIPSGVHEMDQPKRTDPTSASVRAMIWQRLVDSLDTGHVLQRALEWTILFNNIPEWLGGGGRALIDKTRLEWSTVKSHIDAGTPWPIALIFANTNVWHNHQVLAYGYKETDLRTCELLVYDNNAPQQYGSTDRYTIRLDFSGTSLTATFLYPINYRQPLVGFFCADYTPVMPPAALERGFGKFRLWKGDSRYWLVTNGVRMPIATGEISALGGAVSDLRGTNTSIPTKIVRPRDGSLLRERSDPHVYLYQGGSPFWIPDPNVLQNFGGWNAVRIVPDNTLNAFAGPPDDETLLREWSSPKIYRIMSGKRQWVSTPRELAKYGSHVDVRIVPDGSLASIPEGKMLPSPKPGECASLRTELKKVNSEIDMLGKAVDNSRTQREEAQNRAKLERALERKSSLEARIELLGCP